MAKLHMISWELAELAELLKLYEDIYHPQSTGIEELRKEINAKLQENPGSPYMAKNPRGAGRHASLTEAQKNLVFQLRNEGNSIRQISEKTGVSVGGVHKLINEHRGNECAADMNPLKG